jgi:hypothetical protein
MLHLHSLIWLTGNLEFFTLRDRLQSDAVFARKLISLLINLSIMLKGLALDYFYSNLAGRMIRHISSVIKCSIDTFTGELGDVAAPTLTPSARDPESDSAFGTRLHRDANAVTSNGRCTVRITMPHASNSSSVACK